MGKMKKKSDIVKFNTVPNGRIILGFFWAIDIVFVFMCLCLLAGKAEEGFMVLPFAVLMSVFVIVFHLKKYSNVLNFSNSTIRLKKSCISWNDVYITAYCSGMTFLRKNYDIYFFFDDHYLTEKEVRSMSIRRKGFYIILNYERTDYVLSRYAKKIELLNDYALVDRDGVMSMITMHNTRFS